MAHTLIDKGGGHGQVQIRTFGFSKKKCWYLFLHMYIRKQQVFKRQNCVFLTIPYSKHVTKVLQLL